MYLKATIKVSKTNQVIKPTSNKIKLTTKVFNNKTIHRTNLVYYKIKAASKMELTPPIIHLH
jgi:hypothetical protein